MWKGLKMAVQRCFPSNQIERQKICQQECKKLCKCETTAFKGALTKGFHLILHDFVLVDRDSQPMSSVGRQLLSEWGKQGIRWKLVMTNLGKDEENSSQDKSFFFLISFFHHFKSPRAINNHSSNCFLLSLWHRREVNPCAGLRLLIFLTDSFHYTTIMALASWKFHTSAQEGHYNQLISSNRFTHLNSSNI